VAALRTATRVAEQLEARIPAPADRFSTVI
jgi:hypothetical protein